MQDSGQISPCGYCMAAPSRPLTGCAQSERTAGIKILRLTGVGYSACKSSYALANNLPRLPRHAKQYTWHLIATPKIQQQLYQNLSF